MIASVLIIAFSAVLFVYWLGYMCLLILSDFCRDQVAPTHMVFG